MNATDREQLEDDFVSLEYEAHQNGNLNFICFPSSAASFRESAARLKAALAVAPCSFANEDDDTATDLLLSMIKGDPNDLPCSASEDYQALRRVMVRRGFFEGAAT